MRKLISIAMIGVAGCASTGVVSTGVDSYMIAKGGGGPGATGAEMSADLYREANAFCASQKKQFERISVTEKDNTPFVRAASSKIEFRCVPESAPK